MLMCQVVVEVVEASNDRRGEDILLQKWTDLLSVNKIAETPKPAMVDSSINTSNENFIPNVSNMETNTFTP